MTVERIPDDKRPILAAWWSGGQSGHRVGQSGITAIVAYEEKGERDFVPWIAVYAGDQIAIRIAASQCELHYL